VALCGLDEDAFIEGFDALIRRTEIKTRAREYLEKAWKAEQACQSESKLGGS